jgi:hypothetical protein
VGGYIGLSLLKENPTTPSEGSVAYIASDYNTGYMTGDIKLAALSDTDDTDVVGSGTNIISGWANHPSYPFETYTGSGLDITSAINTTSYGVLNTTYHPVIGRTYTVKFNLTLNSGTAPTFFGQSPSSVGAGAIAFVPVAGANSFTWVGTTAISSYVNIMSGSGVASDFSISGFTMYVGGEEDRSVKANGLAVHGTITKTAVATGADLVAYSGFSASNYLEQPYNADLDFGTGEFSVMGWFKIGAGASQYQLMDRKGASGAAFQIKVENVSQRLYFAITDDYYVTRDEVFSTSPVDTGAWVQYCVKRSGSNLYLYVNGILEGTVAISNAVGSLSSSSPMRIGATITGAIPFTGSLALLRISATAPTAAQIKEIYEAEKPLFQENAQATLNGTSDAVQCLAYDDSTELLHVGTSGGRSTFQGLRRVDETATNTTEISAQGGMIIEETA